MVTFDSPIWLLLLPILLPILFLASRRSLAGLGWTRRWLAIAIRVAVVSLLVVALADPQMVRASRHVATVFVLDRSESVPKLQSEDALEIISSAMGESGDPERSAGLVLVGKQPRLELPLAEYSIHHRVRSLRSPVDRSATDLASGIRLALALLPSDGIGRIVLVSDGNETRGDALTEALAAKQASVPIDVVSLEYNRDSEVLVEKVSLPERLKLGDRARLRVVLRSLGATVGVLRIERVGVTSRDAILEERVALQDGVNVLSVEAPLTDPDLYRLEAEFIPDEDGADFFAENNRAGAYTILEGVGRVLLVEDHPSRQRHLAEALRASGLAVVPMEPEGIATDLGFLRAFDSVILADVPAARLDEEKQRLIATGTKELGVGLLMVGGPKSFGPGGYEATPIEEALPVSCQVKSTIVQASLAIVFVIDRSGSMTGDKLAMAMEGAKASVELMDRTAEAGVLAFDSEVIWIRKLLPIRDVDQVKRRIDTIGSAGGTDMGPALEQALEALKPSKAMTKHVIVLSDGVSSPAEWPRIIEEYRRQRVTMSTVAVGMDSDVMLMRRLAISSGGRFHHAIHARAIPQIYIRETRTVSRPLIYERDAAWSPQVEYPTEPVQGLPRSLPTISGFVLTTPKQTSEIAAVSPHPAEIPVNPILAQWQYGLGRSAAFTTDSGERWAIGWPASDVYSKFWSQLIRWSLRPTESRELATMMREQDGRISVVVNAIDANNEFLNFLKMEGTLLKPDSTTSALTFRQQEPGKYVADFDVEGSGSYVANIATTLPNGKRAISSSGLTISYSPEYRSLSTNRDLLSRIAQTTGGQLLSMAEAESADFYRRDRPSRVRLEEFWPMVLLVCLVGFLADVGVRRIAIGPRDVVRLMGRLRDRVWGKSSEVAPPATIERLRGWKRRETAELRTHRDYPAPTGSVANRLNTELPAQSREPPSSPSTAQEASESDADRMSRLLKAKRKVWEERNSGSDTADPGCER